MPRLHIFKTEKETCHAFAEWFAEQCTNVLNTKERFTIAVDVQVMPKLLVKLLAEDYREKIDWRKVVLFLIGEKLTAGLDGEKKNEKGEKYLVENLPVLQHQLHKINSNTTAREALKEYNELLVNYLDHKEKSVDLVLLGISEETDLSNSFPALDEIRGDDAWLIPVYSAEKKAYISTLTNAVINAASVKAFFVSGKDKQEIVQQVLKGKYNPEKYPAQLIQTPLPTVHWFIDEAAASKLTKPAN